MDLMTDPPCLPVAPIMTSSLDIVGGGWVGVVEGLGS
jgi:hypothetical protein